VKTAVSLVIFVLSIAFAFSCGQKDPVGVGFGSLFVDSEPQGALIYFDGNSTNQVTPDTLDQVVSGQHTVSVSLEGYESDPPEQVLQVKPGELLSSFFTLTEIVFSRTVLIEEFTNTSCIPCAEASPILDGLAEEFGRENLVAIKYHPWWPGATDPFYLHNTVDNRTRTEYYFITQIPDVIVDGTNGPPSLDSIAIRNDIEARLSQPSSMTVEAEYEVTGSQYTVRATVVAVDDPGYSDLAIHFAVVESGIHIDPPPGINGETDFEHILRKMLPDGNGEPFTISVDDTLEFERQVMIDAAWVTDNIETVVFVQSQGSLEVLQACSDHK
jgi:thiol-disulfide isomerase/thioredoxin